MNRIAMSCLAALVAFCLEASIVRANLIGWWIDPSVSKLTLSVPDQVVVLGGNTITARVRNESGASNTWSAGNSAAIGGSLNAAYDAGTQQIQFLDNPLGQIYGINSGVYRPNPARFNPAVTDSSDPNGTFTGSTAADFPAVFAGRLRSTSNVGITITSDMAYFEFSDVSYNLTSGILPVIGFAPSTFNPAAATNFSMQSSSVAVDALANTLLVPFQLLSDSAGGTSANSGLAASGTGKITDFPNETRMDLSLSLPISLNFNGLVLSGTASVAIVAYQMPEPSTMVMASAAVVSLLGWSRCGPRKRARRVASA